MPAFRLPVRQLVEFLLRTGSIDSRFTGFDRANEGARIHRKLQKTAGEGYAAEVFLSGEREAAGIPFTIEGRADGIFTDEAGVTKSWQRLCRICSSSTPPGRSDSWRGGSSGA